MRQRLGTGGKVQAIPAKVLQFCVCRSRQKPEFALRAKFIAEGKRKKRTGPGLFSSDRGGN